MSRASETIAFPEVETALPSLEVVQPPAITAVRPALRLRDIALGAVARLCDGRDSTQAGQEAAFLRQAAALISSHGDSLQHALHDSLKKPSPADTWLVTLARDLPLAPVECLAVALAASVEDETFTGRVLAHVQAPIGGSRPTLGLMSQAFAAALDDETKVIPTLLNGSAAGAGLLAFLNESAPLPERAVMVPTPLCLALAGHDSYWPGTRIGLDPASSVPLPESVLAEAWQHAPGAGGAGASNVGFTQRLARGSSQRGRGDCRRARNAGLFSSRPTS